MEVSKFFAQHSAGHPFKAVHEGGKCNLGRVVDQEVNVIDFAIELDKLCIEIGADRAKYRLQRIHVFLLEDATPIFCHEDQVCVDSKNAVPTSAKFLVFIYRPIIIYG